jgi:hypothetical protein
VWALVCRGACQLIGLLISVNRVTVSPNLHELERALSLYYTHSSSHGGLYTGTVNKENQTRLQVEGC